MNRLACPALPFCELFSRFFAFASHPGQGLAEPAHKLPWSAHELLCSAPKLAERHTSFSSPHTRLQGQDFSRSFLGEACALTTSQEAPLSEACEVGTQDWGVKTSPEVFCAKLACPQLSISSRHRSSRGRHTRLWSQDFSRSFPGEACALTTDRSAPGAEACEVRTSLEVSLAKLACPQRIDPLRR